MAAGQFHGTLGANEIIYTMTLDGEEGLKCVLKFKRNVEDLVERLDKLIS